MTPLTQTDDYYPSLFTAEFHSLTSVATETLLVRVDVQKIVLV
jgi:hypothetical protein